MAKRKSFDFKDYSTVEEFIASEDPTKYSYYKTCILEKINNIEYPVHNIIYDYLTEIKKLSTKITLDSKEFERYMYRPDLLSYDTYGNTELDFVILALNELASPKDFIYRSIYLLTPKDMKNILNMIYNAETEYLNFNRAALL